MFKLTSVEVQGTHRYSQQDLIAASGLTLGETAHEDDFKAAAERLGTSGAFTQVSYRFDYGPEGTKVQFQVTDAPRFVPVVFENFVWFPDAELTQKLHSAVPLFHGELPSQGDLPDQVSEALQAMVAEKGIPAEVDYQRIGAEGGPLKEFVFSVSGPTIEIGNVNFDGAAAAELPLLQAAAQPIRGEVYQLQTLQAQVTQDLLPVYLKRGFLKAQFSAPQPSVVKEDGPNVTVNVTFSVSPGLQYKVAAVEWSGNRVFSAARLSQLIHLQTDKPADSAQLQKDLGQVQQLYATKGYMGAAITPKPVFDDSTGSVRYILSVNEGSQYKMGEIDISGLGMNATSRLMLAWTLKNGQPYNSNYLKSYLAGTTKLLPPGDWKTTVHQTLNKDKTVDISLRFDQKGPELP